MTATITPQPFVPWTVKVSSATVWAAQASPFVLVAGTAGFAFQVLGFRMALAGNFFASVAGAYDIELQSAGGPSTVALFDAPVLLPAAAGATSGTLYDSGWMRFDPSGIGSAVNGLGGNLQIAWAPANTFTGLIAVQLVFNQVKV